ncbi:hypothetical protein GN956_G22418 [Arapaima gigas]
MCGAQIPLAPAMQPYHTWGRGILLKAETASPHASHPGRLRRNCLPSSGLEKRCRETQRCFAWRTSQGQQGSGTIILNDEAMPHS